MDLECHEDGQRSKTKFFLSSSLQIVLLSPLHSNLTLVGGRIFPGGPLVKNPPAKQETWVQSLGQEDPLEKEVATHSSILAWERMSHGQRSLVGYSPLDHRRVGHDLAIRQQQNSSSPSQSPVIQPQV